MEVIRLSGYTLEEKKVIARRHLIPKQLEENGLTDASIEFTDSGVSKIIEAYTREAGLRNLEREIGAICRKVAVSVAKGKTRKYRITGQSVEKMLGPVKHFADELLKKDQVGVATGLAWTSTGGDILFVEALAVRGKGTLRLTGQLGGRHEGVRAGGDVPTPAPTAASSRSPTTSSKPMTSTSTSPRARSPRTAPRAGITMGSALISAFTQRPARRDVAMTGEITLRGEVLPIGGVKEKASPARHGEGFGLIGAFPARLNNAATSAQIIGADPPDGIDVPYKRRAASTRSSADRLVAESPRPARGRAPRSPKNFQHRRPRFPSAAAQARTRSREPGAPGVEPSRRVLFVLVSDRFSSMSGRGPVRPGDCFRDPRLAPHPRGHPETTPPFSTGFPGPWAHLDRRPGRRLRTFPPGACPPEGPSAAARHGRSIGLRAQPAVRSASRVLLLL
jgi:hypothetical protein